MNLKNKNKFRSFLIALLGAFVLGINFAPARAEMVTNIESGSSITVAPSSKIARDAYVFPIPQDTLFLNSKEREADGNISIHFGKEESLVWDHGNGRFELSDDLWVKDGFRVGVDNFTVNGTTGIVGVGVQLNIAGKICDQMSGNCSSAVELSNARIHATTEDKIKGIIKGDGMGNYTAVTDNSESWDQAFMWGNHAAAGYLTPSVIGVSIQPYDRGLTSIANLGTTSNKMLYTTAKNTYAETTITAAGRAILDDKTADEQRTTLGLGNAVPDGTYKFDGSTAGTVSSMTVKNGIITTITTRQY